MITVRFLVDDLDTIPTLVKWFRAQWPDYYAAMSDEAMEQDFLEDASRDRLPIRLIAFEFNELAGTIILRKNGNDRLPEFQPELGGLYVVESYRHHGIATELIRSAMQVAREQGYETVFATTIAAAGILKRLGWEFIQTGPQDGQTAWYRCKL
jgi:N-acetylglutamate synthase-like GNAT family acetyltransferase